MNPTNGMSQSDHDLLIKLNSKVDTMLESQSKLTSALTTQHIAFDLRIREIENKSNTNCTNLTNMNDDINELQKKSNLWDGIIGAVAVFSSVIGAIFGNK